MAQHVVWHARGRHPRLSTEGTAEGSEPALPPPLGQQTLSYQASPLHLPCLSLSLSLSHSYESSAEILPHTPRLTHFPTVSGSPASLADSMQQKRAGPRRRRPQNPSAM